MGDRCCIRRRGAGGIIAMAITQTLQVPDWWLNAGFASVDWPYPERGCWVLLGKQEALRGFA